MSRKHRGTGIVFGYCDQCERLWMFEGNDAYERYREMRRTHRAELCRHCCHAKSWGAYRYDCEGCGTSVSGSFADVVDLLNVAGKTFCRSCMTAFFGRYDAENPALTMVLASISAKVPTRTEKIWRSDILGQLAREELRYGGVVRRLSKANFKNNLSRLNPDGRAMGRSGVAGSYQIDHIVPISDCWEHRVPAESAADVRNLQFIPWQVNISRGNRFSFEKLIGWPYPIKTKKSSLRPAA